MTSGDDSGVNRSIEQRHPASLPDFLHATGNFPQRLFQPAANVRLNWGASKVALTLAPGSRLGVYEVTELIGHGGMGAVYRAHDTRLGRNVAIKVLPDAFGADPDRVARFEREARALASLNHPHIGAIYGLEDTTGSGNTTVTALVLELIHGPSLDDRLAPGPLPLPETLRIARQIADPLEAAHERGIIHRDLKPVNIKLTSEGHVKVLDFGLAKLAGAHDSDVTEPPTTAGTVAGMILGTPRYMSPEQARGRPIDKRTDIWAFGAVLYEMLTGRSPFSSETPSDTIPAILGHDPDWRTLPKATPPPSRNLLHRCLEKEPRQRLRDIGDARIELDTLLGSPAPLPVDETSAGTRGRTPNERRWLPALAVAGAVAGRQNADHRGHGRRRPTALSANGGSAGRDAARSHRGCVGSVLLNRRAMDWVLRRSPPEARAGSWRDRHRHHRRAWLPGGSELGQRRSDRVRLRICLAAACRSSTRRNRGEPDDAEWWPG
jgi:serine/threonine protein kinase